MLIVWLSDANFSSCSTSDTVKSCGVLVNSAGWRLPCRSGPPVDGPKDPWPRVLSLPGRFVGDPASLARDNILRFLKTPPFKNLNRGRYTSLGVPCSYDEGNPDNLVWLPSMEQFLRTLKPRLIQFHGQNAQIHNKSRQTLSLLLIQSISLLFLLFPPLSSPILEPDLSNEIMQDNSMWENVDEPGHVYCRAQMKIRPWI